MFLFLSDKKRIKDTAFYRSKQGIGFEFSSKVPEPMNQETKTGSQDFRHLTFKVNHSFPLPTRFSL